MKFSAERDTLLIPLQHVFGAVERKQTSPVLGNVLIQAKNDTLTLTGTDNEIELQATSALHTDDGGEITVQARKLLDICKNLPASARIDIESSDASVVLKSGRSKFKLATLPADQFPILKPLESAQIVSLTAHELLHCIKSTSFSMAQQDVRFYLNGMLLEISADKLSCVATDGHRLAYSHLATEAKTKEPVRAIIPRKSITELQRLLGSVEEDEVVVLAITQQHMQIQVGSVRLSSKLIEGRFPDYNRVIPTDGDKEISVDSATLKGALTRASVVSSEKYRGVRLSLESGVLTISSNNPDQEEALDEMEVDYAGDKAEIGFNVTYLLDVLNAVTTENVRILLKDGNSSALVMPQDTNDSKYVVMPMRL